LKKTAYPTPQDAEAAFYEALELADLDAMMEVWSEDDEVSCVHPGGPRLFGYRQVRENWAEIFASGQRLQISLSDQVAVSGMMFSLHSLHENILVRQAQAGVQGPRSVVIATNAYMRSANGWRMVLHHGSPAPAPVMHPDNPLELPKILH
jgi:ketosteroid isomerase-like protein